LRYVIVVGDDPDAAALLCSPMGGPLIYHDHHEACEAAHQIVRGHTVKGAFVMKFVATAFYLPIAGPRGEPSPCPVCAGEAMFDDDRRLPVAPTPPGDCPKCGGVGRIPGEQSVVVDETILSEEVVAVGEDGTVITTNPTRSN
jgi:hypothetical protein